MITELPFDKEMIARAKQKAVSLGYINNSILKGAGNLAGYLGEEALAPYVGAEIVSNNRRNSKNRSQDKTPHCCTKAKL